MDDETEMMTKMGWQVDEEVNRGKTGTFYTAVCFKH